MIIVTNYKINFAKDYGLLFGLIFQIVDDLIRLNYLDHKKGFYDRGNQSRTARMRASDGLIKLFKNYKLQPDSVGLLSSTPSIILRDITLDQT